jgi:hypothetical protein
MSKPRLRLGAEIFRCGRERLCEHGFGESTSGFQILSFFGILNDFFSRIAIIGLGYARLPLSLQFAHDSAA